MKYADRKHINGQIFVALNEVHQFKKTNKQNLTEVEKEAIEKLYDAISDISNDSVDYSSAAEALCEAGQEWKKIALLCYEIIMSDAPTMHDYQNCGQLLVAEGHYRSAREFLETGLAEQKDNFETNKMLPNIYANLATACLKLEDNDTAIEYASDAMASCLKAHMHSRKMLEAFDGSANPDYAAARNILLEINGTVFTSCKPNLGAENGGTKIHDRSARITLG